MINFLSVILIFLCSFIATSPLANASIAMVTSEIDRIDKEPFSYQTWNQGSFLISKDDGSELSIELLRPKWWFKEHQILVGHDTHLSLPEMGVDGSAKVLSVSVIPPSSNELQEDYEVVTGKFTHENIKVIDLYFDNEKPLGVTVTHPFWSMGKGGWVDAGDLHLGESVKTIEGTAKLVSREDREGLHTVYNLEVHRRHTFYVSDVGVLVHNTCIMKGINKGLWGKKDSYVDLVQILRWGKSAGKHKKGKWTLEKDTGSNAGTSAHQTVWKLKDGKRVWAITAEGKVLRVRPGK